ncbi:MAG TPA: alpha-mannosidase, partial [Anaerolineales bacterium]
AMGGEQIELYVEVAVNTLFGIGGHGPTDFTGLLQRAELAVFDREAWDLYWDFVVLSDMALQLPANTPRGGQAIFAANAIVNAIDLNDRGTWPAGRAIAAKFLAAHNGDAQFNLSAVGHAHIDTAWLWPLAETERKCIRTFSSAVSYMEDYPEYKFACSQAQQYEWIKQKTPGLYEKIKERIKEGRFIPSGGSWVEPDCNIPSGESLVRQFLFGQRFFRQEFGITCREFWEPDVFGYSAALPQILRGVGMPYFLTIKLSWSQFNKIGAHTFWWEGLDGSRVLTHFPPADDYNAMADVAAVLKSSNNYRDIDRSNESYMLFGYGDGGGGPTKAMLEQIRRMENLDGLPKVSLRTPNDFFTRLEADAKDLTTWVGELYLELHRGTYTTQARNKLYNRQSEFLLHDVEFLSAVAHALQGSAYPSQELSRLWKLVLTNQFHDIIPGSSIPEVYKDSTRDYEDILSSGKALRQQAVQAVMGTAGSKANVAVINTLGIERTEVVALPAGTTAVQTSAAGEPLGVVHAPSLGYHIAPAQGVAQKVKVVESGQTIILENEMVCATFTPRGGLVSLFDKRAGRESIEPGTEANHFVLFDDDPTNWDAWDVDVFHLEKRSEVGGAQSVRVVEHGPLRAAVEFEITLSPVSTLKQTVTLSAISPRLDFANEVEWHEAHKFLKVEFPLAVRAVNATYEVQFGHLQRPTHFNTSWDMARFEVCGHKWADLSETGFGVSLINDSKYGHAAHGNVLRLSLLRSPKMPDPNADMGHHAFRFALLPHAGTFQDAGVVAEAFRFNVPLLVSATQAAPAEVSFFNVDNPAVVIDTVKKAEDSDAIIVRMYEAHGSRGKVTLTSSLPVKAAARVNLLEEEDEPLAWSNGSASFDVTPFKLVTIKLTL